MKKRLLIVVAILILGMLLLFPLHASAHASTTRSAVFSDVVVCDVSQGLQSGFERLKQATEHITDSTHRFVIHIVDGLWQFYESTLDTSGYMHHN